MSKLFLVHDFSPDSSALFSAFSQHARLLAENSLELAPLNSLNCESVLTHDFLWFNRGEILPLPPRICAMWADIAEKLDSGKNVLMFTRLLEPASHEYFWRHLAERVDLGRHAAELLFILGRPSLLLEQCYRTDPAVRNAPLMEAHGEKWLGSLAPVLSLIRDRAGSARCEYLFNTAESPVDAPRPELFGQVFDFLGCPLPELSQPGPSVTDFKSHQTRRLFRALEVRSNAWPALDAAALRAALLELDRELPKEWVAPLAVRRKFARTEAEAVSALEGLTGASPGSLAPTQDFLEEPEADLAAPLSPTLIKAFVARIPTSEREKLRARLLNDRPLLNADHEALLAALSADGGFSHMGEAVPPPELTVLTMTFNHEKFIAQCMDSVLQQKTDFPVQHLVLDHYSTDGTAAIVAEYARKHPSIRPVLLSQHLPYENVTGLFERCRSKYAALCDGDDYFTEPTKLQRQVDMLEANPGLGLCFHPVAAVFDDGTPPVIFPPLSNLPKRSKKEFYLADLMNGNFIQTNSVVYRWRFREGLPAWFRPDLCPGDFYWHMLHAETGK
ncbi:MAG: glycosyltransferase family 2 protein, partial [Desulfovibrio sp.]|nr:glycosyltransferase family 2 protein [Desulfovibrio sp.]